MPTFLSDPPQTVYLALAALALVFGAVWSNRRTRRSLVVACGVLGLTILLLLLDISFVSPREEALGRVQAMVRAADAKDPNAFVEHLADTVEFQVGGQSKPEKRETLKASPFWGLLRQFEVRVVAWDYAELEGGNANTTRIGFMAKGESGGRPFPVYIVATFTRQADGKFKLTAFQTLNPVNRTEPIAIPNFP